MSRRVNVRVSEWVKRLMAKLLMFIFISVNQ